MLCCCLPSFFFKETTCPEMSFLSVNDFLNLITHPTVFSAFLLRVTQPTTISLFTEVLLPSEPILAIFEAWQFLELINMPDMVPSVVGWEIRRRLPSLQVPAPCPCMPRSIPASFQWCHSRGRKKKDNQKNCPIVIKQRFFFCLIFSFFCSWTCSSSNHEDRTFLISDLIDCQHEMWSYQYSGSRKYHVQ